VCGCIRPIVHRRSDPTEGVSVSQKCAASVTLDQDAVLVLMWSPTIVRTPWTTTIVVHSPYVNAADDVPGSK
jgi:hypothetical protein